MLKIAIWGLGAMGAAIAERLRQAPDYEVLGFDIEPANIRDALAIGVIHGSFEPKEISEMPFDLVVIAVPPTETVAILQNLHTTNLIVDVASVKQPIMTATEHLPHFVGGHPMASTDETGFNGRRKVMLKQAH
ncbi:MAG: prephenate dehydrogenase/arogenate dehydrogenase family protein, partial [Weissella confusa]|nr:prephenate dehydrogenase/arogenate dehydrogenase family protein [Weissella confusa]